MNIEIIILDDEGQIIATKHSTSFESATEDLGKLERYMQKRLEEEIDEHDKLEDMETDLL